MTYETMPGKYLGTICDLEVHKDVCREYSIELRPGGGYVLYVRTGQDLEFVPVCEGLGGASLAEFCVSQGLDCQGMLEMLARATPAMAGEFSGGLLRLAMSV